ncbi:type II secretion system protein [Candidatus Nomurabacteria bacterium]|nr:type II secretion system protein [Candidatus Nomurabacteria bacterium]
MNQVRRVKIKKNKFLTGFTLIELLVIIAIISLLSSIVLVNLKSVTARARDAKRVSELNQIRIALELYYDTYGGYPSSAWPEVNYTILHSIALEPKMAEFIKPMPRDPRDLDCYNEYLYVNETYNNGNCDTGGCKNNLGESYVLYATLENQEFNNLSSDDAVDNWLRDGAGSCAPYTDDFPNYRVGNYHVPSS